MTDFSQLKLMYNQFDNLSAQINQLIADEDYETADLKTKDKEKLIKKIFLAKKTVKFSEAEKEKIDLIDKKISEANHKLIASMEQAHRELAEELSKSKKKVKINSAYDITTKEKTGKLIDTSE